MTVKIAWFWPYLAGNMPGLVAHSKMVEASYMRKQQQQTAETPSKEKGKHAETIAQTDWYCAMQGRFLKNFYMMSENNDRLVDSFRPEIRAQQISKIALCGINLTPRPKKADRQPVAAPAPTPPPVQPVKISPILWSSPVADVYEPVLEEEADESCPCLSFELLTEVSSTPMPSFELMNETELNQQLDRFGAVQCARRKLFNSSGGFSRPLIQCSERRKWGEQEQRVVQEEIPVPDGPLLLLSTPKRNKGDLTETFMDCLRRPENEEVYNNLLNLNPVMMDRLLDMFGTELRARNVSRTAFAEMLDKLHVTYCVRKSDRLAEVSYVSALEQSQMSNPVVLRQNENVENEQFPEINKDDSYSVLDFKMIKEISVTPLPNFDSMSEIELNQQLDRVGTRPMCKAKAIQLLKKIYEATHPVLSDSTPITKKVADALSYGRPTLQQTKALDMAREKRTRAAISKMTGTNSQQQLANGETGNGTMGQMLSLSLPKLPLAKPKKDPNELTRSFLDWLRQPGNEDLYNDLLTLNPIMLDRLLDLFGPELRAQKISQIAFADMLDKLHVTYCPLRNATEKKDIVIPPGYRFYEAVSGIQPDEFLLFDSGMEKEIGGRILGFGRKSFILILKL
uniref:Uncharacterized protein n=1 Tax=Ditylenchus dipsaci TaxID=166011 RepID=A0A915EKY1_9BILA